MIEKTEIQQILDEADDLPSLPGITQKVLSMSLQDSVSLKDIGNIITMDAALVMRFLKIVNSAYYGFSSKIKDIHQAVAILGADTIRNIAITLSLIDVFPVKTNEEYTNLFKRSLCSAVTADFISQISKNQSRNDIFLAGMLQNLGMYILMRYMPERYLVIIENARKYFIRLPFLERFELGVDNSQAGYIIAQRWQLPETVCLVIKYKEKPALFEKSYSVSPDLLDLMKITYLGGLVADIYFGWNKAWNIARLKKDMLLLLNHDENTTLDLLASIPQLMKDAGLTDFTERSSVPTYNEIIKKADDELRYSWTKAEENFFEFYNLNKKVKQKDEEIKQLKAELDQSRQTLQRIAEKFRKD